MANMLSSSSSSSSSWITTTSSSQQNHHHHHHIVIIIIIIEVITRTVPLWKKILRWIRLLGWGLGVLGEGEEGVGFLSGGGGGGCLHVLTWNEGVSVPYRVGGRALDDFGEGGRGFGILGDGKGMWWSCRRMKGFVCLIGRRKCFGCLRTP